MYGNGGSSSRGRTTRPGHSPSGSLKSSRRGWWSTYATRSVRRPLTAAVWAGFVPNEDLGGIRLGIRHGSRPDTNLAQIWSVLSFKIGPIGREMKDRTSRGRIPAQTSAAWRPMWMKLIACGDHRLLNYRRSGQFHPRSQAGAGSRRPLHPPPASRALRPPWRSSDPGPSGRTPPAARQPQATHGSRPTQRRGVPGSRPDTNLSPRSLPDLVEQMFDLASERPYDEAHDRYSSNHSPVAGISRHPQLEDHRPPAPGARLH